MRKAYQRVSWMVNGVMIGLIIAGLIDRSLTTLLIGASAGLVVAIVLKVISWLQQRSDW